MSKPYKDKPLYEADFKVYVITPEQNALYLIACFRELKRSRKKRLRAPTPADEN